MSARRGVGPMTIAEAFRDAGIWFRVGDYQLRLTCTCGAEQDLGACATSERGAATVYACKQCGDVIAGIMVDDRAVPPGTPPGTRPPDDDGHRMCGYVFGAKVDMELWPPAATEAYLQIPRRPAFLTSRGLGSGPP